MHVPCFKIISSTSDHFEFQANLYSLLRVKNLKHLHNLFSCNYDIPIIKSFGPSTTRRTKEAFNTLVPWGQVDQWWVLEEKNDMKTWQSAQYFPNGSILPNGPNASNGEQSCLIQSRKLEFGIISFASKFQSHAWRHHQQTKRRQKFFHNTSMCTGSWDDCRHLKIHFSFQPKGVP